MSADARAAMVERARQKKNAAYMAFAKANYRMTPELCAIGDAVRYALGLEPLYVMANAATARGPR